MLFYGREDPATGSAAGPAIAWLVRHGRARSGETVVLEQGVEMQRPSRLYLSAQIASGEITEVFVGGRTIPVATGRFFLP
jgi:trans-2,3-dihydro-3-hydroxyanthranilate isomerase